MKEKDWFLIVWTVVILIWDVFVIGGTAYLVFWEGHSGVWFVLAILLCIQSTYFDVIRSRYNLPKK